MTRLSPVLTARDLPMAELHALRLDGQLLALDEGFTVVDQPIGIAQRADSLAHYCDDRLIVEQHSAAWVWGALPSPPARHELCASVGARSRSVHTHRLLVREVVITPTDWMQIGRVRVTTPLRTVSDLSRFSESYDHALVEQLLTLHGLTVDDVVADLTSRRNLPRKKIALARLSRSAGRAPMAHPPCFNS
jgi:hypothetical protein